MSAQAAKTVVPDSITSDLSSGKKHTWVTVNLLCQIALGVLAMTICLPSMPSWIDTFASTQADVQLTFSAYLMAFAFAQLIYGPLSDIFGRRRILLIGLAIGLAGSLAAALAQSLDSLILARALQGTGTCAGMAVGRAMIQDNFTGSMRTRIMAYVGMVMGLCPPLATLVGGQLHIYFGWRSTFVAIALVGLLLIVAALVGLPAGRARATQPTPSRSATRTVAAMISAYGRLLHEPSYLAYCLVTAFTFSAFYAFLAAAPSVFASYGVGPDRIGWFILLVPGSYVLGNYVTSRLSGRYPESMLMTIGQALNLLGIGLVLWLAWLGWHWALAVALPLMLLGFGHGLVVPPALAGAVGAIPALAGAAAAMAGMLQQAVGAMASYLVGFADHSDASQVALFMLLLTALAIAAQIPLRTIGPAGNVETGVINNGAIK